MMESRQDMRVRGVMLLGLGLALPFTLCYIGEARGIAASLGMTVVLVTIGGLTLTGHLPPDEA